MSSQSASKRRKPNSLSDENHQNIPGDLSFSGSSQSQPQRVNGHALSDFKPGNLITLRVWNFTTYGFGEFHLSPSLNMIIGPNGTGKSTFVAAVCLGLGGKVDLIKRKSMDMMIKSGEKEARIEITMKNNEGQPNLVFERIFFRKVAKSQWKINGNPTDISQVRQVVSKFNIQLDNLCHFLPQERVSEFATLSPEKLLLETERTIGDNTLLDRHKELITLDESWVDLSKNVQILEEQLGGIRTEVEKLESEAQKFKEFEEKTHQIAYHKKVLPYAKLQDLKEKMAQLRQERDKAKKALQEFDAKKQPLHDLTKDAEKEMGKAAKDYQHIKADIEHLKSKYDSQKRKADNIASGFSEMQSQIENLKMRKEKQKQELDRSIREKEETEQKLSSLETVDMSQLPELMTRRQNAQMEKSQIVDDHESTKVAFNRLKRDLHYSEQANRDDSKKLESNDRIEVLRTRNTRYRKELMASAYEAHSLVRKERTPDLKYYEAPVVCCSVTDRRYAKYFEKVVDNNTLFAFYFDSETHYKAVSRMLPEHLNVPMRVAAGAIPRPPMPVAQLKELGFDGYLSDFVSGPEAVVRGLNQRSFLNSIPVSVNPINPDTIKKLLKPSSNGRTLFRRFIVGDDLFVVNQSKYGSKQVFYQTERIASAQLMDAEGISADVKREIRERIVRRDNEINEMREKIASSEADNAIFQDKVLKVDEEINQIGAEIKLLRKKQEARSKIEGKISHLEELIHTLTTSTTQDQSEHIRAQESQLSQLRVTYAEAMKLLGKINDKFVKEYIKLAKAEILQQKFKNKLLTYVSLSSELDKRHEELKEIYKNAKAKCDEHKKSDLAEEVRSQNLTPEERQIVNELVRKYMDEEKLSEMFIVQMIQQLQEDLGVLTHVDRGSLELLNLKKADLENAERNLPIMRAKKEAVGARIKEIAVPWENELSTMIEKISKAFQKRFVTVASDGQVELRKMDRFKDWKLEILVKFREDAPLKVLDHQSQSGGERAVSTIFFIMSLQGLTKAPIRIVDEINQGMDPKNEKMAHKYLVYTACNNGQSQFFLVTPKLLTGLYYHPKMTIHCIFTGPLLKANRPGTSDANFLNLQARTRA